jgi:formylglycine-generating enzyme required for sulfatase activity
MGDGPGPDHADASDAIAPAADASGDGDGAGGADGSVPHDDAGCPSVGAAMTRVPAGFCIDTTEVTRTAYADFLATVPSLAAQPPECAWSTTFVPEVAWPVTTQTTSWPVAVNWCQATAYCAFAGKRLCTDAEWAGACSYGGTRAFPYGNTYVPQRCNGKDVDAGLQPVGSFPGCFSYPGLLDLQGNVNEWTSTCMPEMVDAGALVGCDIHGGSYSDDLSKGYWLCGGSYFVSRSTTADYLGFRCCAP